MRKTFLIGLILLSSLLLPIKSEAQVIIQAQSYISGNGTASGNILMGTNSIQFGTPSDVFIYRNAAASLKIDTNGSGGGLTAISLNGTTTVAGSLLNTNGGNPIGWVSATRLLSPADKQLNFVDQGQSIGVGIDVATDAVMKIRTRAQSAYATLDALGYNVSGVAGATHAACSVSVTAITVTGGLITAITCT